MSNLEWKNTDPRDELAGTQQIIIVRPAINCRFGEPRIISAWGEVETEHSWSIWTGFEDHKLINANTSWDQTWKWILYNDEH